jgi:hypothetical protein
VTSWQTPVLDPVEARALPDSIDTSTVGMREDEELERRGHAPCRYADD